MIRHLGTLALLCMACILGAPDVAAQTVHRCDRMPAFASVGYGVGTASGECYLWPGSSREIKLYYPREWGMPLVGDNNDRLAEIFATVRDSLATYTRSGLMTPPVSDRISIAYTTNIVPPRPDDEEGLITAAVTNSNNRRDGSCAILLVHDGLPGGTAMQFTVAHEVFHCVQINSYGQAYEDGGYWWQEGSAEFAANLVYPTYDDEHFSALQYVQDHALFDQGLGYPATIFFQSLSNKVGTRMLAKILRRMPDTRDAGVQYTLLAGITGFDQHFHDFTREFVDRNVTDTSGGTMAQPNPRYRPRLRVEGDRDLELEVTAYEVGAAEITLAEGKKYSIANTASEELPWVSYKEEGADWQRFPPTTGFEVKRSCDGPVTVRFAISAVSDRPDFFTMPVHVRAEDCDEPPPDCVARNRLPRCVICEWNVGLDDLGGERGSYDQFKYHVIVHADGKYEETLEQSNSATGPRFNGPGPGSVTMQSAVSASSKGWVCRVGDKGLRFIGTQTITHSQKMNSPSGDKTNSRSYPASAVTTETQFNCEPGRGRRPPFAHPANINILQERARRLGL